MNEPQYIKIYKHLKNKIITGGITEGETLETEMQLTQQFSVSRVTIRKSMKLLVDKGFVERKQGRGTVIIYNKESVIPPDKDNYDSLEVKINRKLIGFVLPDISSSFGMKILEGIEEEADKRGFFLVIKLTKGEQKLEGKAINDLLALGVSGLIILPQHGEFFNPAIMELSLKNYPYVLIDLELKGLKSSFIGIDNKAASFKAVTYLLDKGHKKILYLSPSIKHTTALEDRLQGAKSAFIHKNLMLPENFILTEFKSTIPGNQTIKSIEEDKLILHNFLSNHSGITAIFASEYRIALVASIVLSEREINVPDDISIICFDSPENYVGRNIFTHIKQDQYSIGCMAIEKLNKIICGDNKIEKITFPVDLIEGTTTKSL